MIFTFIWGYDKIIIIVINVKSEGNGNMIKPTEGIKPFLTFSGCAEEAVNFYVSIFPNSKITNISKYGKGERVEEGKLLNATFELKGNVFLAMDIEKEYAPGFSWGISLFITCESLDEFDHLFNKLSSEGNVLMGPEPIFNLRKVAWVTDKFGVTWQLVWE